MQLHKFILILCVLLILRNGNAWRYDSTGDKNYTHHVKRPKVSLMRRTQSNYEQLRRTALLFEESGFVGSDLHLSAQELKVNEIIMKAKADEYKEGLAAPHKFAPAKHFFNVLNKIENSKLFSIIAAMPKGALLHTHSSAMGTTEFLIELTRRDHLWACTDADGLTIIGFEFNKKAPTEKLKTSCKWTSMADLHKSKGEDKVEEHLREKLSLYPTTDYQDNNEVWDAFESIFDLLSGLLQYAPARKDYFKNALEKLHKDGVQYVEIRTSLSTLYDLDGTNYNPEDTLHMYETIIEEFQKKNPSFSGCKLIISAYRRKSDPKLNEFIKTFYEVWEKFPNLIAGFDLVGQEEKGRPLNDMLPKLLEMQQKGVNFYFHAGETNWFGSSIDENLIDAILLGTKRIGHGYALIKHPSVLESLKDRDIAVEINPISNQVLELIKDLRSHPASYLFSHNYPVVVASDDPSFWKATPLSHDFYMAFMGIASAHADLKFLKKLILNSFKYSAMTEKEKDEALLWWHTKWFQFLANVTNTK